MISGLQDKDLQEFILVALSYAQKFQPSEYILVVFDRKKCTKCLRYRIKICFSHIQVSCMGTMGSWSNDSGPSYTLPSDLLVQYIRIKSKFKNFEFFPSFAVSENDLRPLLENHGLDDVLKNKKLFIVDYRILDGIKGMPNKTVVHIFYYHKNF